MIEAVALGTCRLCLKSDAHLQNSHFIAAAFYKIGRALDSTFPHPVFVTPDVSVMTSEQTSERLLCADCEQRFNRGGEDWILRQCWKTEADFPLYDTLKKTLAPRNVLTNHIRWETAGIAAIDMEKLAYFAASVIWRAGVHDWRVLKQKRPRLRLGPYEEALRQYLVGGSFPQNVILMVAVSGVTDSVRNITITFPYLKDHQRDYRLYVFRIPGIAFLIYAGNALTPPMRAMCSYHSPERFIYMSDTVDERNFVDSLKMISKSRLTGALRKNLAD
jgi:hypothetical protein